MKNTQDGRFQIKQKASFFFSIANTVEKTRHSTELTHSKLDYKITEAEETISEVRSFFGLQLHEVRTTLPAALRS
jgi:hypothetical protein